MYEELEAPHQALVEKTQNLDRQLKEFKQRFAHIDIGVL
jgi:hypothetical protein